MKTLDPAGVRRSNKVGINTSAKIEYLDLAFFERQYAIVGVQESCIQGSVTRDQVHYHVNTSGAQSDGFLGVESWLSKDLVRGAKVRPRAHSPRLLTVYVDSQSLCFAHVVAHAPTNIAPPEDRRLFWQALRSELLSIGKSRWVFLTIDANATMGAVESSALPFQDGTAENENGTALRHLLEENSLYAASMNTQTVLPTWFGGRNQHEGRRIDYVCVSDDPSVTCPDAGVDMQVHLSGKDSIDHVLTFSDIIFPFASASGSDHIPRRA